MKNVSQWKSTVLGLISIVVPVLVAVGWIKPELQGPILEKLPVVVEAIFALVAAAAGFWGIFKLNDNTD